MQPLVELINIQATPPSLSDNTGDLDRLKKCLAGMLEGCGDPKTNAVKEMYE